MSEYLLSGFITVILGFLIYTEYKFIKSVKRDTEENINLYKEIRRLRDENLELKRKLSSVDEHLKDSGIL